MSTAKGVVFDEVHTLEKQSLLAQKMADVAEEIHCRYELQAPLECCPCCGSDNHVFYAQKFGFTLDRCKECRHIFTNPMPSEQALNYYYNSDLKTFENKFFNDSRGARVKIFADRLVEINKHAKGKQLLDIGSAVGIFLDANRQAGSPFDITSCDLSEEACAYIRAHYEEVHVVHSDVMLLPDNRRYDCITLWDTLEHIVNPNLLLQKISRLLNPDGILCFSTPNTESFEWKVMGVDHVQLLPPGHVNLYNISNIHIMLANAGFVIDSIRTPNASLDVSYISKMVSQQECANYLAISPGKVTTMSMMLIDALWANEPVKQAFIEYLREKNLAGNMLVIARPIQGS